MECRRAGAYWTALSVALMMLSGCSTSKPPTGTLAEAEWGVRAAGEAKANDFALLDLNNARAKLEKAKLAMAAGNYDDARRFAESARVDAGWPRRRPRRRFSVALRMKCSRKVVRPRISRTPSHEDR